LKRDENIVRLPKEITLSGLLDMPEPEQEICGKILGWDFWCLVLVPSYRLKLLLHLLERGSS